MISVITSHWHYCIFIIILATYYGELSNEGERKENGDLFVHIDKLIAWLYSDTYTNKQTIL